MFVESCGVAFGVYQMCCAVWAVDFSALCDFAVALAARFKLRATITIS
jgi:hypothetical protein